MERSVGKGRRRMGRGSRAASRIEKGSRSRVSAGMMAESIVLAENDVHHSTSRSDFAGLRRIAMMKRSFGCSIRRAFLDISSWAMGVEIAASERQNKTTRKAGCSHY